MARPLSDSARRAMANDGQQIAAQVDIVQGNEILFTTDPESAFPIVNVIEGKATFDETRTIVSDADVTLLLDQASEALIPTSPTDPFSPVSPTYFIPKLGFVDPLTGQRMLTQLGVFELEDNDIEEQSGGLRMALAGPDQSARLDRAKFLTPYAIASGTNYVTAAQALVMLIYPTMIFRATPTSFTTPLLSFDIETSYLDAIMQMMEAIGYTFRFDWQGQCVMRPVDQTGDPQWALAVGSDTKLLSASRALSKKGVYNGVIIRGESPGSTADPVQGEAWDTDPTSRTYYDPANPGLSQYGPVPYFETSSLISALDQANSAATAKLLRLKGLVERVRVETRMNPAVEIGDLVSLERPRIGVTGTYVVESVSTDLRVGRMPITMRERRL